MAGISTGVNLLAVQNGLSSLTYSVASFTGGSSRVATATPNPDSWGATGFTSTSSRGLTVVSDSFFINPSSTGTYPNYTILPQIKANYMGTYTGNITPNLKDSQGVDGNTSGIIPVNLNRTYTNPLVSTYAKTVSIWQKAVCIFYNSSTASQQYYGVLDTSTNTRTVEFASNWTTVPISGMGIYNEIKFEDVSGSPWNISLGDGTVVGAAQTKGTYYNIDNIFAYLNFSNTAGTTSAVIRVTMRNKLNNAITLTHDVTLSRTF